MWKMSYYLKHSESFSHIILHIVCSSNARELCVKTRCPCVKFVRTVSGKSQKVSLWSREGNLQLDFMENICIFRQQLTEISMLLIE